MKFVFPFPPIFPSGRKLGIKQTWSLMLITRRTAFCVISGHIISSTGSTFVGVWSVRKCTVGWTLGVKGHLSSALCKADHWRASHSAGFRTVASHAVYWRGLYSSPACQVPGHCQRAPRPSLHQSCR